MTDYRNPAAEATYRELLSRPESFPFAFTYGGEEHRGFGGLALCRRADTRDDISETTEQVFALDALHITLKTTLYPAFGAYEWTVFFENVGDADSAVLRDPHSEVRFKGSRPALKGIMGDWINRYRPYAHDLAALPVHFSSDIGRATHVTFPYFNLEVGDGGAMLAIGWAGTWKADFVFDGEATVYTASSVNGLCTRLRPGEKIRTALFLVAPYTVRNENYATNYWRRFFVECNLMRFYPAARKPFSTVGFACDTGLPNSDGSISERSTTWRSSFEKMLSEGIRPDVRWLDAGWYAAPDNHSEEVDWWGTVGTWEPDLKKWPGDTLLESTDFARAHGMKTLAWFEPERVTDPENLAKNYGYDPKWAIRMEGTPVISNNIGDPDCLQWTIDRVCGTLKRCRIELYREDVNCDPASLWAHLDAAEGADRRGITECKFIAAHYRLWDAIIACEKEMGGCGFVDSCAGGGGRNDIESMRRGVPLWRSDSDRSTMALRLSYTTALSRWLPFSGSALREGDRLDMYIWRASYNCSLNVSSSFTQDPDLDFELIRRGMAEWDTVKDLLLKDMYLLTPWHGHEDSFGFTAFCYHDPETDRGAVLAFRQENCAEDTLRIRLPFAAPGKHYRLRDADGRFDRTVDGVALREGVDLFFEAPRTAMLLYLE